MMRRACSRWRRSWRGPPPARRSACMMARTPRALSRTWCAWSAPRPFWRLSTRRMRGLSPASFLQEQPRSSLLETCVLMATAKGRVRERVPSQFCGRSVQAAMTSSSKFRRGSVPSLRARISGKTRMRGRRVIPMTRRRKARMRDPSRPDRWRRTRLTGAMGARCLRAQACRWRRRGARGGCDGVAAGSGRGDVFAKNWRGGGRRRAVGGRHLRFGWVRKDDGCFGHGVAGGADGVARGGRRS